MSRLRNSGRIGLIPFVPAGYPDLDATAALLPALARAGASVIEVGIPFSDPIADGPTIQAAFSAALARKIRVDDVFATITATRASVSVPMVAMLSFSIVYRYGVERFIAAAVRAGLSGLILPDLPPPEAAGVCGKIRAAGLDTILLVAPTSSPERRRSIVELCSGFVYYISVTGITGERASLPADLPESIRQLRPMSPVPLAVGFGISTPEHVAGLRGLADAAIVGSAVVKRIQQHEHDGPKAIADAAEAYCRHLLRPVP